MLSDNARIKMMITKLAAQSAGGFIENEWAEKFIWDVKQAFENGRALTEKQLTKLEELFEQY